MMVGIVGYGDVGKEMAAFFNDKYEVVVYDPKRDESTDFSINNGNHLYVGVPKEEINKCDLAVICVPEDIDWLKTPLVLVAAEGVS